MRLRVCGRIYDGFAWRHAGIVEDGRLTFADCARFDREIVLDGVLFPGFVNAHAHLDLFFDLPSLPFEQWVPLLIEKILTDYSQADGIHASLALLEQSGVRFIGDIARPIPGSPCCANISPINKLRHVITGEEPLHFSPDRMQGRCYIRNFCEFINRYPDAIRPQLHYSPHALYTVPHDFLRRFALDNRSLFQMHVAESPGETGYFLHEPSGDHFYDTYLARFQVRRYLGEPLSPVRLLESLGLLTSQSLLVHMGMASDDDLDLVAASGAKVITCPVSNHYLYAPHVELAKLEARGIRYAIGTDGKCSHPDLDFLRDYRLVAAQVGWEKAFLAATSGGAEILGLMSEYTLEGADITRAVVGIGDGLNFTRMVSATEVLR